MKLTLDDIKNVVTKVEYIRLGTLTICVLTLKNGFKVTGQSACISPETFDQEIGEKLAYEKALDKVWELEGYLLTQMQFEGKANESKSS